MTTGKISSNEKSYDLTKIYDFLEVDFTEIYFKIKAYYTKTSEDEIVNICEYSNIYTVIFRPESNCELNVWTGDTMTYPLFMQTESSQSQLFIKTPDGIRNVPLVDSESVLSSDVHINTPTGIHSIASRYAKFTNYPIDENDTFTYFDVSKKYTHSFTNYAYKTDTYYYRTSGSYNDWHYSYKYGYYYYKDSYVTYRYGLASDSYQYGGTVPIYMYYDSFWHEYGYSYSPLYWAPATVYGYYYYMSPIYNGLGYYNKSTSYYYRYQYLASSTYFYYVNRTYNREYNYTSYIYKYYKYTYVTK